MTTFTKKHYNKIAAAIATTTTNDRLELLKALTDMFKADNPAFDLGRFIEAATNKPKIKRCPPKPKIDAMNDDGATPGATHVLADEA